MRLLKPWHNATGYGNHPVTTTCDGNRTPIEWLGYTIAFPRWQGIRCSLLANFMTIFQQPCLQGILAMPEHLAKTKSQKLCICFIFTWARQLYNWISYRRTDHQCHAYNCERHIGTRARICVCIVVVSWPLENLATYPLPFGPKAIFVFRVSDTFGQDSVSVEYKG